MNQANAAISKANLPGDNAAPRTNPLIRVHRHSSAVHISLVLFAACSVATAQDYREVTSFATIDIQPPQIRGNIWIDVDSFQAIRPIDTDGDTEFNASELNDARGILEGYLRASLDFLWDDALHFVNVADVNVRFREQTQRRYFVADFRVPDFSPGRPVTILSRVLRELPRGPRLMALINHDKGRDYVILGPLNYYISDPPRVVVPPDSPYRPKEERGRPATLGEIALEVLYALPEGAVCLYVLEPDLYHPHGLAVPSLKARVWPIDPSGGGESEKNARDVTLEARPLPSDKTGSCSRFVASIPEWKDKREFKIDVEVPLESKRPRAIFTFNAIEKASPDKRAQADQRFACPKLCLGMETRRKNARCVFCGSELIEVRGAPVPGAGQMGRHGGVLNPFSDPVLRWEGFMAGPKEWRLYLTNEDLAALPVGDVSGTVAYSRDENFESILFETKLTPAEGGAYLRGDVPDGLPLPCMVRCSLAMKKGAPTEPIHFTAYQVLAVPPPERSPTTRSGSP